MSVVKENAIHQMPVMLAEKSENLISVYNSPLLSVTSRHTLIYVRLSHSLSSLWSV